MKRLRTLGLVQGRGALPKSLREACYDERLVGGLSISLRASADEVMGPLTHAMGGPATKLKVLDVRTGTPMVIEVQWGELKEKWEVESVEALITNLGDLFRDEDDVKPLVVLGEWEDMLQVWALRWDVLEVLLSTQLLDEARNVATLRARFDEDEDEEAED